MCYLKDVVFGVNKVVQSARELREYNKDFNDIYAEYVQPTIDQFNKDGSIDEDLVKRGIWMGVNFVTLALQSYATFNNIGLLQGVASKSALAFNYWMGVSQTTLAVGSLVLTGIETYNYSQYSSLIDKIEKCIKLLEAMDGYQNYPQKKKLL
eukprot:801458_1